MGGRDDGREDGAVMLELVKQNIHMNRWKNQVETQITLDDDFIVPDTMSDMAEVLLDTGELILEPVKQQKEKAVLRGKLDFHVLYRKEEGGLQAMGGLIPFEETVNVPELEERDYVSVVWQIEDLHAEMIHSRKLNIKAIVALEVKAESIYDAEAAADVRASTADGSPTPNVELKKSRLDVASIALRRKDTYRMKEVITLASNKPAIDRILWTEMRLGGVSARPLNGTIHLEGALLVFVIYEGEGENAAVQWMEESLPFSGDVEMQEAKEEMIPAISVRLVHKGLEEKPDYDGEMRELEVDAVMELDVRLYEEQPLELIGDLYATNCELKLDCEQTHFDRILMKNTGKCKLAQKVQLGGQSRILQICHSTGNVKLDDVSVGENTLNLDGVLEVRLLCMTDDDRQPVQVFTELLPFHHEAEAQDIDQDSIWYLENGVEQLTAVMTGGDSVEVKAVVSLDLLVLQPVVQNVIRQVAVEPLDEAKLRQSPGIVGYLVQEGDTLWDIAKRFRTTAGKIREGNNLSGDQIAPGDCLILMKEIPENGIG